jgi:hypothetical protein
LRAREPSAKGRENGMRGMLRAMDLMAFVFWGFVGLVAALMVGVYIYFWWTHTDRRFFRARPRNVTLAEVRGMQAAKVPGSLASVFKVVAVACALLGLVVLGWLATLE